MTNTERSTVVGVFQTRAQAEGAIKELRRFGFTEQEVGYAVRDARGNMQGDMVHDETHTRKNAIGGAVSGGVVGGLVGAASSLLIPGLGPAIAGGILGATLGGAAIGATAGGLIGALTEMGVPEEDASYYQNEFEAGRFIVTVTTHGQQNQALEILRRHGAYDASTRQDFQGRTENLPYAQVGAAPSLEHTYDQSETYNQAKDTNAQQSYDSNDAGYPTVGRPYNLDTSSNSNSPNAY